MYFLKRNCNLFHYEHNPPDWLIKPPPTSPFLSKNEYENKFTFLAHLIDNYLMKNELAKYVEFNRRISHDFPFENNEYVKNKIEQHRKIN